VILQKKKKKKNNNNNDDDDKEYCLLWKKISLYFWENIIFKILNLLHCRLKISRKYYDLKLLKYIWYILLLIFTKFIVKYFNRLKILKNMEEKKQAEPTNS